MIRYASACAAICFVLGVLTVASSPALGDITDDLFAYWNMDGDFGESIAGADGTLVSTSGTSPADFVTGKFGNAIDLDSSDDQRVEILGDTGQFTFAGESISISAWFTVDAWDANWQALIAKGESTAWRVARRNNENVMGYAGGTGDIPGTGVGPDVATDGDWHHIVAITENAVSTRLWVDGQLIATSAGAPTLTAGNGTGAGPMMIGGNPDDVTNNHRSWNGAIDDVGIWNRAITDNEIAAMWNSGVGAAIGDINFIPHRTDFNADGFVNIDDYNIMTGNFLTGGDQSMGDANGNGFIDLDDFALWRLDFEDPTVPSGAFGNAIPEPSSILLGVLIAGMLAATRRRSESVA